MSSGFIPASSKKVTISCFVINSTTIVFIIFLKDVPHNYDLLSHTIPKRDSGKEHMLHKDLNTDGNQDQTADKLCSVTHFTTKLFAGNNTDQ